MALREDIHINVLTNICTEIDGQSDIGSQLPLLFTFYPSINLTPRHRIERSSNPPPLGVYEDSFCTK